MCTQVLMNSYLDVKRDLAICSTANLHPGTRGNRFINNVPTKVSQNSHMHVNGVIIHSNANFCPTICCNRNMSAKVLPSSHQDDNEVVIRPKANFHPSIWGNRFINSNSEDEMSYDLQMKEIEELKEEVRKEIHAAKTPSLSQLELIDAIQRLGVGYHFEKELEEALQHVYVTNFNQDAIEDDLYCASLHFRLLRQHGYNISCDVFNKFKDDKGSLKVPSKTDVLGMLALYEAAHLAVHGEDILDEAVTFTRAQLNSMIANLSGPLAKQVIHALRQPLHKSVPRLDARNYIAFYKDMASHNQALLTLAMLDFNLLQSLHKQEISEISKWWKEMDVATKLPFARDRIVECFFCILGMYYEPQYSCARKLLTKVIALISIIDDTYDAHGTSEELKLFTEAIRRWDRSCKKELPDYMQIIYEALLNIFIDVEKEIPTEDLSYRTHCAKNAIQIHVQAYYEESKWLREDHIPTMEEYMRVALITSGFYMLTVVSFVGMQNIITKEAFDWVSKRPLIIRASETVGRLLDDIKTHKFEQQRGHVASAVECYMKQYDVTEDKACEVFRKGIHKAWKDINQECLKPTEVPMALLMRVVNLTRILDVFYEEEDCYTHVGEVMKQNVALLLIDPVPI